MVHIPDNAPSLVRDLYPVAYQLAYILSYRWGHYWGDFWRGKDAELDWEFPSDNRIIFRRHKHSRASLDLTDIRAGQQAALNFGPAEVAGQVVENASAERFVNDTDVEQNYEYTRSRTITKNDATRFLTSLTASSTYEVGTSEASPIQASISLTTSLTQEFEKSIGKETSETVEISRSIVVPPHSTVEATGKISKGQVKRHVTGLCGYEFALEFRSNPKHGKDHYKVKWDSVSDFLSRLRGSAPDAIAGGKEFRNRPGERSDARRILEAMPGEVDFWDVQDDTYTTDVVVTEVSR